MKIKASDPDLETIYGRITGGSLDLQPDFQRAEVWKTPKKKLLIDTILRDWQVPPVHVIYDDEECTQEVLDGQQRLCAIRDFMSGEFKVDGKIEPLDDDIIYLDGLHYYELPARVKSRFDRYSIKVFEIVDYSQGEPGELFNRLNESLKLTSAEKRNAYVGELRRQIKSLVTYLINSNVDGKFLGFSNQRLAYHDLFIKLCFLIEKGSLFAKYTEKSLNDRARDDLKFNDVVIDSVKYAIDCLSGAKAQLEETEQYVHVTKATVFSWLYFIAHARVNRGDIDKVSFIGAFIDFESTRYAYRNNLVLSNDKPIGQIRPLFESFNERATSRVMTASSLAIRDLIISLFFYVKTENATPLSEKKINKIKRILESDDEITIKSLIEEYAEEAIWEGA